MVVRWVDLVSCGVVSRKKKKMAVEKGCPVAVWFESIRFDSIGHNSAHIWIHMRIDCVSYSGDCVDHCRSYPMIRFTLLFNSERCWWGTGGWVGWRSSLSANSIMSEKGEDKSECIQQ